ncbi:autotransporter outer membrane beta-barrel domain-containing protein [Bradyrhizobium sp. UFLA03-84]|uniref:autotransporter family protein n=1 Tax=Bradyrhizobium sp. UFLA03-84 TaxID=418599 RepID=UPI0013047A6B|nr:autotransporter outer membrane beta-barrel domain-containing protein [Bradyrhizobium sp. UFLA03-84]
MVSSRLAAILSCTLGGGYLLSVSQAFAACDNLAPVSGQTVTCSTTAPNPSLAGVQAAAGSSNVTVNVLQGAGITPGAGATAIGLISGSTATNNGTLTISGGGTGIFGSGNGNVFTNGTSGLITTTGAGSNAIAASSSGNTLINNGTITTQNGTSRGLAIVGLTQNGNNTLINTGTITTQGPQSYGLYVQTGDNNKFMNSGTITTSGAQARAIFSAGQFASITNTGTLLTTGSALGGVANNTVFMQGNANVLTNSGIIEARGAGSDAVFSNTAGSSFTATIQNLAGGQIISQAGPAIRTLNGVTTIVNAGLIAGNSGTALAGGTGNVTFILQTGSQISGLADGGAGNNQVRLQGSGTVTNPFTRFQTLTMEGSDWTWAGTGTFANTFINSGSLTLQTSLTGNVSIAAGTSLLAGNGANPSITSFAGGPPVTVTNAGVINLTNGGATAANSLTIAGNYVGNGGSLFLRSVLGSDGSPSDRLVISGGNASGSTAVAVSNAGGAGAETTADGIMVVQAVNGGTTAPGAFGLSSAVVAGAHEYLLFRGGVSAGSADNWYLRSTLLPGTASPAPPVVSGGGMSPSGLPAEDLSSLTPPPAGAAPVELYREEVSVYSALPQVAQKLGLATLGTFHQRQGDQALLTSGGEQPAAWARAYGSHSSQSWAGTVSPSFDGTMAGVQVGVDILRFQSAPEHHDRAGFFYAYGWASGTINGFAVGIDGVRTGTLSIDSQNIGGYWTHIGPSGWYVDAVLMGSFYGASPQSDRQVGARVSGTGVAASLETGVPIPVNRFIAIEPQAQLIWQRQSFDSFNDLFSSVAPGSADTLTGRLGVRIPATVIVGTTELRPYLEANLWHTAANDRSIAFATTDLIGVQSRGTAVEIGAGVSAQLNRTISAYASAGYTTSVDSLHREDITGRFGLRVSWQ